MFRGAKLFVIFLDCLRELINFIVSNIGNCVIVRLDRRLCKFIYNLLHNNNLVDKQITEYKMLSPSTRLADNYRYLCSKYKYSYNEWYSKDVNSMLNKTCVEYIQIMIMLYVKLFYNCVICVTEYLIVNI